MTDQTEKFVQELRGASDRLVATLDELYALEDEKRTLQPGSPRFVELATRIERLARTVLGESRAQEGLAFATRELAATGAPAEQAINDVRPRAVQLILADWRDAERRLEQAAEGSPDRDVAAADVRRLRGEYGRAIESVERD